MTTDELRDLENRWLESEEGADVGALDELTADDFRLVGPLGFVLDKQQWLDRYRTGELRTRTLLFEEAATRVYGHAAVTIGRHVQQAEHRGRPADGSFRATHIAVRDGARWRLVGQHLSPIGGPPPFAGAGDRGERAR